MPTGHKGSPRQRPSKQLNLTEGVEGLVSLEERKVMVLKLITRRFGGLAVLGDFVTTTATKDDGHNAYDNIEEGNEILLPLEVGGNDDNDDDDVSGIVAAAGAVYITSSSTSHGNRQNQLNDRSFSDSATKDLEDMVQDSPFPSSLNLNSSPDLDLDSHTDVEVSLASRPVPATTPKQRTGGLKGSKSRRGRRRP
ncbi:hypothetical protein EC991_010035 [Linnemannia zychae]|nr:hypothetical protein EC991_010035 [Linnemannia zychae]